MFIFQIFIATTALALSSSSDEKDRVIDLQELLLNVSDSYPDFGQGVKELKQDADKNVKLINDNIQQVVGENSKKIIENANTNSEKVIDLLKQILKALGKTCEEVTSQGTTLVTETVVKEQGKDCAELYARGERENGIYNIAVPSAGSFPVFCDMTTDGGGWTVIQRRGDFGLSEYFFYKNWTSYKNGFGELTKEFWLGNDKLFALTKPGDSQLRVDLWDLEEEHAYAHYATFKVLSGNSNYMLNIGEYSGTAGNSMVSSNKAQFSTYDKSNNNNCHEQTKGSWWFSNCYEANLNGLNLRRPEEIYTGIYWRTWRGISSLSFTEMKIRSAKFDL